MLELNTAAGCRIKARTAPASWRRRKAPEGRLTGQWNGSSHRAPKVNVACQIAARHLSSDCTHPACATTCHWSWVEPPVQGTCAVILQGPVCATDFLFLKADNARILAQHNAAMATFNTARRQAVKRVGAAWPFHSCLRAAAEVVAEAARQTLAPRRKCRGQTTQTFATNVRATHPDPAGITRGAAWQSLLTQLTASAGKKR